MQASLQFAPFFALPSTLLALVSTPAIAQDPIGSYAGASIQFNDLDTDIPVAAEGSYSFTDNLQLRATLGEGLAAAALTASVSTGQWRFAAGPSIRYTERESTTIIETPASISIDGSVIEEGRRESFTTEDNSTDLAGVVVVERALGEFGVVFGSVSFSDDVSGAIGAGLRF